ncbi:MAG TPA: lytic transglycosylase domain-containing protein [Actinomycetes bacterium]|nr:lytic transglycosylase domain-containing protein [Actinomycetes bacterium]
MSPTAPTAEPSRAASAARIRRRLLSGLCIALSIGLLASIPGAASAETADQARARADAAAERVAELQDRVVAARKQYEKALQQLAGAVTTKISADAAADSAAHAALTAEREEAAAVRALEQSGGSLGMFAGVLDAGSPSEFVARWKLSTDVVSMLSTESDVQQAAAEHSADVEERTDARATRSMVVMADVQGAYSELNALLDEQQEILDTLDAEARRLAQAERVEAQIAAERAAAAASAASASSEATAGGIPKSYLALYQSAAATCQGLPWPVLAAIGQVESGHGSNTGPSSAGAMGPMQFLPSTFAAYAVDGDGDGTADIWNPADAIYSAANYLCANGAGAGPRALYNAIWHYNHADWYVQMVMQVAAGIARNFNQPVPVAENPSV